MRYGLLIGLLTLAAPVSAFADASLEGRWVFADTPCNGRSQDRFDIDANSISGDLFNCMFFSSKKDGDLVTWKGVCANYEDVQFGPGTFEARLVDRRLTIKGPKLDVRPLKRCRS